MKNATKRSAMERWTIIMFIRLNFFLRVPSTISTRLLPRGKIKVIPLVAMIADKMVAIILLGFLDGCHDGC